MSSESGIVTGLEDVEKGHLSTSHGGIGHNGSTALVIDHDDTSLEESTISETKLSLLARRLERLIGMEARGIHRVKENEKTAKTTLSFMQIILLWLSINTAAQNITLASIGQSVYGLGFLDAALCSVFGGILGSIPAAYIATWGPLSGNRTMVRRGRLVDALVHAYHILDICPLHHGMVADEALCAAQSRYSSRLLHDRCRCCRADALSSVPRWQPHSRGRNYHRCHHHVGGHHFWHPCLSLL
jgi:hypothetical protein